MWVWELNSGPPQEQPVHLTTASSQVLFFEWNFNVRLKVRYRFMSVIEGGSVTRHYRMASNPSLLQTP